MIHFTTLFTRRAITVAAAATAVFSLAACSSGGTSTTLDPTAKVTVTWWSGQDKEAEALLETLAREFEGLHPNVTIDVSPGASSTDDLLQKLVAGFAGGNYPSISYAYGSWASEIESSGKTQDLSDRVTEPDVGWDEFSASARATVQPTGQKIIGFPALVDNVALYYNKTVFDAAGVAYPTADWTWDDFRKASKELTDPSTETYGYGYSVSGSEETTWLFWPHLWQNGGAILSSDSKTATFNSDAGVKALTFLQDMAVTDKSMYLDQTDTKFAQLFAADRIGMMTSGPWQLYDLQTAGTNYGVTILPGTNGDHQTVSGPDIWALMDTKDANENYWSFELVKWLTQPAQDVRWNVAYGNLPLRSSELTSPEFLDQVKQLPGLDTIAENSVNAITARPTVAGYVGLSESIANAISSVLQGQGDPKSALDKAKQQSDEFLAGN